MEMLEFLEGWSGLTCCLSTLLQVIKDICTEATAIHCHRHPTNRPPFGTDTVTATVGPSTTGNPPSSTLCYDTQFVSTYNQMSVLRPIHTKA